MEAKPQISYKTTQETKYDKNDFYIEQIYTSSLSQYAYYIESNCEAAIIDPMRDLEPYLRTKSSLKYIFETTFHMDFVSGNCELSKKTNAEIVFGPNAVCNYKYTQAVDNQGKIASFIIIFKEFKLGKVAIKVMHTPGHSLEASSFILIDSKAIPFCVFTGNTVFIGDLGRIDLAINENVKKEELAGILFDSVHKIKTLPNNTIVLPGHGTGSLCGKNIGKDHFSTIGDQKDNNKYMKDSLIKDQFVKEVTQNIPKPPVKNNYIATFLLNAKINRTGPIDLDEIISKGTKGLNYNEFIEIVKNGAIVLDVRPIPVYLETGYVKESLFIDFNNNVELWASQLLKTENQYVLICEKNKEKEIVTRMARVGFEKIVGVLNEGINEIIKNSGKIEKHDVINPEDMKKLLEKENPFVLDVRKIGEYNTKRIENALLIEVSILEENLEKIPKDKKEIYVQCRSGSRSLMAIAILKKLGFNQRMFNVSEGIEGLDKIGTKLIKS